MTQHTKGPLFVHHKQEWEADNSLIDIYEITNDDENGSIVMAEVYTEADAKLYAAAPELLAALEEATEALKDIINAAGNGQPYTPEELEKEFADICGKGLDVLGKAKGESA